VKSIRICREPTQAHWQLGPLPPAQGHVTLVSWSRAPGQNDQNDQQDGGVPADVVGVLARALSSVARVTFPSSQVAAPAAQGWSATADALVRPLMSPGALGRAWARLRGAHIPVLISTRESATIGRAFDDPAFPWWLQGQVLLLSVPDVPPPDIDEPALVQLFGDEWAAFASTLEPDVYGALRPGVDGAIAGFLALTDGSERSVLGAIERETRRAGLMWEVVGEADL
jgi:hypothetical protein